MSDYSQIEYLDLAISAKCSKVFTIDKQKIVCHFNNNFRHKLHDSNHQLNSIVDLIIALGKSLEVYNKTSSRCLDRLTDIVIDQHKKTRDSFLGNLDYIKNTSLDSYKEVKTLKQFVPSKEQIDFLSRTIARGESKRIEEDIKKLALDIKNKAQVLKERIQESNQSLVKSQAQLEEIRRIVLS